MSSLRWGFFVWYSFKYTVNGLKFTVLSILLQIEIHPEVSGQKSTLVDR
ncbi:MAG: hypothetical protein RL607_1946 [Bacteroidota bacterium]|jgi:hypothetical protein